MTAPLDALGHEARMAREIVEAAPHGIVLLDLDGLVLEVNRATEELLGYGRAEIVGKPCEPFTHPEDHAAELPQLGAVLRGESDGYTIEKRYLRRGGDPVWARLEMRLIRDGRGEPLRLLALIEDVSERRRLDEEQKLLRDRLESRVLELAEAQRVAHIGSFEWDIAADRISWSDELYRIYGLDPAEFAATFETFVGLLHPDDRDRVVETIQRTVASGEPWRAQERIVRPTGETRYLTTWGELVPSEDGRPARLLGICHDVTEQHDLRDAMETAERASRAKSEFLASISHELRTPMNAILGFAQLLELDELSIEQEDSVQQILRAGRHLLELITELLEIERIEAGELALSLEPVSLEDILGEAVTLTRPLAEQLDVTVSVEAGVGGWVLADTQRLRQVLINLLMNGVKYNRPGGTVTVGCTDGTDTRLAIAVRDTGRGIPDEDLERLWVPFDRLGLEGGTIEGAGLGLTLAQRLVQAMAGTIAVESESGVGTTFTVELPRAEDPLAALEAVPAGPAPQAGRTATILYIEDNLANLKLVERALARRPGLTMLEATHGRRGLELARERRPDLVLLDLHLPDITGEEVLDELASSPETAGIPVVVVSAAASKGRVQRLCQRGARDYLTKPIDIVELLEVVTSSLGPPPA